MESSRAKEVRRLLEEKISRGFYTGAAVLWGTDRVTQGEVCAGTLQQASSRPITPTTLFDIQSITKVVATAPTLLALRRQGAVDFRSPVQRYLPAFAHSKVRVLDLVNHSSGLSDDDLAFEWRGEPSAWNTQLRLPLRFEPGSAIEYADLNYRVLGRIIASVSGEPLASAVDRLVFRPMGMIVARYGPISEPENSNVAGGPKNWGRVDDEQDHLLGGHVGCDGVFASALDLANFSKALLRDAATMSLIAENSLDFGVEAGSFYESLASGAKSFGWESHAPGTCYCPPLLSTALIEKAGGAGAFLSIDPASKRFLVYLTNHGRPTPFDDVSWNALIRSLDPRTVATAALGN